MPKKVSWLRSSESVANSTKKVNSFTIFFDLKNPLSNSTQVIAKKVYNCSNIN